jgi:hypothetical protein
MMKPKIFVWVNSGHGSDWQVGMALAEDGTFLASHVSSCRDWFRHDMGVFPDGWKHDVYRKYYPDGYEVVEVLEGEEATHEGLLAAYALNQTKKTAAKGYADGAR